MNQQSSLSHSHQNSSKTLQKYKKRLLFQVIAIFSICLLVILQRIFYQVIIQQEQIILSSFQMSTNLISNKQDTIVANQIKNGFLQFIASLSQFRYIFLIFTHYFITIYVAFDAIISTKIMYVSFGVIYIISLLQLFYAGARPFWTSKSILCSNCLNSYSHPTLGLVLLSFIPYYTYYCWKKKAGGIFLNKMDKNQLFGSICIFIFIIFLQFMGYFTGGIFIINIALSVVCFLLLTMISITINSTLDKIIKKSTVIKVDAKKYVFYWLLLICLLMTFVLIVYSGSDVFLDIDWVKNYINCTQYLQYESNSFQYDEVIGPWFNFLQTATLFGWIGAVFGVSKCFRKISSPQWYKGQLKNKILRILISNILVIPSWIFVVWVEKGNWIRDIGLNQYIVDCIHYFILYFWLFGWMPVYLLEKGLKLTHKENGDFYVILSEKP